jgi:ABC-2 type transport system ATP-binding protein
VRRIIGLAGQHAAVEPALTGRENLVMVARLFGHGRRDAKAAARAVLAQIGLEDAADRLVRGYSGGMRRRLDLGASLVGAPRLLLLDEPTTGLDPRSRMELWDAIRALVQGGTTVLLTTQYLEEADQLADEITIVDHGRAIATGSPETLKRLAGRDVVEVRVRHAEDVNDVHDVLAALGAEAPRVDAPTRRIAMPVDGSDRLTDAVRELAERRLAIDDIGVRRPTLDEVFLTLTGTSTAEAGPHRTFLGQSFYPHDPTTRPDRTTRPRPIRSPPCPPSPFRVPTTLLNRRNGCPTFKPSLRRPEAPVSVPPPPPWPGAPFASSGGRRS